MLFIKRTKTSSKKINVNLIYIRNLEYSANSYQEFYFIVDSYINCIRMQLKMEFNKDFDQCSSNIYWVKSVNLSSGIVLSNWVNL